MACKKHSEKLKFEIVQEYQSGRMTYREIGKKYSVDESSIRRWVAAYSIQNSVHESSLIKFYLTFWGQFNIFKNLESL